MTADITNTGHADMVECQDGSWYMVFLASRPYGGYHKNLGRETFIAPVVWEDEWPVVSPGTGKILMEYPGPAFAKENLVLDRDTVFFDDFSNEEFDYSWNWLGTPTGDECLIVNKSLRIKCLPLSIGKGLIKEGKNNPLSSRHDPQRLGFLGRRQQHMRFVARTEIRVNIENKETEGLIVLQNDYHQLRLEIIKDANTKYKARVIKGYRSLD